MLSCTSINVDIGLWWRPRIQCARANQPVMVLLFDHMRTPSCHARTHEHQRIEIAWNVHQKIGHGGIEIQVGEEPLFFLHDAVYGGGHVIPPGIPTLPAERLGMSLDNL